MNKVLVTGATGLVGFSLARAVVGSGRPVKAMVRSLSRGRSLLGDEVEIVSGDVTDRSAVRNALTDCSVVYHAAGLPEQWLRDESQFGRVNFSGTSNLIEEAMSARVKRFIYVSTVDVFKGIPGKAYDERDLDPAPKSTAYGRSKQAVDRSVAAAVYEGLPAIIVHPAAVYGPGPIRSPTVNQFIRKVLDGDVPVVPPGKIPLVYAPSLAAGCLAAEAQANPGDRFIFSESYVGFREIARVVGELSNRTANPTEMPWWLANVVARVGEAVARIASIPPLLHSGQLEVVRSEAVPVSTKAKETLGWRPTPLRDGLRQTVDYLRS